MDSSTRINKYLALHKGVSRREADDLVSSGKVTINGVAASHGSQVSTGDTVAISGEETRHADYRYVLLHKPVGYVCSRKRQGDNPTIYELLPEEMHTLKPVGRLDKDSSGVLVLTNDGDFAHSMTHPSFKKTKVYTVHLDVPLQPLHQQMISDYGVMLDDGKSQFLVSKVNEDQREYEVTMQEGRNRQIRRTFVALGYTVTKLHRTQFGIYTDAHLAAGEYKAITL